MGSQTPESSADAKTGPSLRSNPHEEILASTLDPVITIDPFGTIRTASRSVARLFGWTPEDLIGRNVTMLMPDPHASAHDGYLSRYLATGKTSILGATRELVGKHRDGHVFPIELSVARVEMDSGPPLFAGIVHDISDRRVAEAEMAADRQRLEELVHQRTAQLESTHEQLRLADRLAAIGTLAAGLGHDMNNVLLPIRMRLDAVEAFSLPEAARDHLTAVRRSVEYLQQLSDGLHLLALDPADDHASSDETCLSTWWQQAGPLLSRTLPRHVQLTVDLDADAPPVRVPSHRLTQAILNLMVNAAEAVDERGEVRLWSRVFPDRRFVELGVTDNGSGMTSEVRRRALEPFFTTKSRGLGTGLGLSLAHGVAVGAGGTLAIDSAPGEGTTVRLTLAAGDEAPLPEASAPRATTAILIDDPRLHRLVSMLVAAADLGDGAPEAADAIITDDPRKIPAAADTRPCLLLGAVDKPGHAHPALHTLADPHDFEHLRGAVHQIAHLLTGARSS